MDRKEFILKNIREMLSHATTSDACVHIYPNIPPDIANNARLAHKLDSNDEILYLKDLTWLQTCRKSFIFTESCWSEIENNGGNHHKMLWENISSVKSVDERINIYNTEYTGRVHFETRLRVHQSISNTIIAKYMNQIAQQYKSRSEVLDEMLEKEEYEDFLVESEKLLRANADVPIHIRANRVRLLIERGPKAAYQEARIMLLNFNDNLFTKDPNFKTLGEFVQQYEELCDQYSEDGRAEALPYWTQCRDLVPDEVSRRDFQKKVDSLYTLSIPKFLEIPYHKRKFLAIDSKLSMFPESLHVLKRDELPEGVIFPEGHPVENELYICHPYKHNLYIPYETCEFVLFEDKVREYCEVLECLGAKEVFIEDSLNDETTTKVNRNLDVEAGVDIKLTKASADIKKNSKNDKYESLKRQLGLHQEYNPIGKPSIPNDLVWYPHETKWQRLSAQRQRGSITKHDEFLSISTELQTSTNELTSVKADFRALIVKIKGNVSHEVDSMFENKTSSEWKVSVEFYPLSELPDSAPQIAAQTTPAQIESNNSRVENEYREEVKFCFEDDGEIDEKERAMLNRLQTRLGISDDRAKEIEADVISGDGLSATEKDYYELYEEFLKDDGSIDERERRLLQREQSKLGLSDEKVKELESKIN